jgi:hypothetical protein
MSAIAEPPVNTTPPTAAPKLANGGLPDGIKIDRNYDPGETFTKHVQENPNHPHHRPAPKADAVTPTPPKDTVPPKEVGTPTPPPETPPVATDLSSQLTDGFVPESAKAQKEPAKVEATASDIKLPDSASPKAHEAFNGIRTQRDEARTQLQAARDEIAAAKAEVEKIKSGSVVVDSPEIQKLRTEHEAMSKRLMILDLQSHPKYQAEFVAPRQAAISEAQNILAAAGIANVDIDGMLAKDPVEFRKQLSAAASKLPTALDQSDFATAMRTAHALKQRGDSAVSKAGEINKALNTQTVEGYKKSFEGTWGKTIGSLVGVKELVAPAGATPEQLAEVESFNNGFRSIRSEAEKIALGTTDPDGISRAAIKAAAYEWQAKSVLPMMSKVIKAREAEIAELKAKLENIRSRNPNIQIRGTDTSNGGVDPSKMNHHEAAEYFSNLRSS